MVLSTLLSVAVAFVFAFGNADEALFAPESDLRACTCPGPGPVGKGLGGPPMDMQKGIKSGGKFGRCPNFACGVKDACTNPADQKIWNGIVKKIPGNYRYKKLHNGTYTASQLMGKDIGMECRSCWGHQPCTGSRVAKLRGYTKQCGWCMGEVGNCYARHCSHYNKTYAALPKPKPPCTICDLNFYKCAKVIPVPLPKTPTLSESLAYMLFGDDDE